MNSNPIKFLLILTLIIPPTFARAENFSLDDIREVRTMIGELLHTSPSLIKDSKDPPVKIALMAHPRGVHIILSKPEIINAALDLPATDSSSVSSGFNNFLVQTGLKNLIEAGIRTKVGTTDAEIVATLQKTENQRFKDIDFFLDIFAAAVNFDDAGLEKLNDIKVAENVGKIGNFIVDVLRRYFKMQAVVDKRLIMGTFMKEIMPGASENQKMLVAIKSAGPFFQKLLQLVGDYVDEKSDEGKQLKQTLNEVKRSLTPIDNYQLSQLIQQVERASNNSFSLSIVKTLGVASVGHALLVTMTDKRSGAKKNIVLKFIKPGVAERAKRDATIFSTIARQHGAGVVDFFNFVKKDIFDELDFKIELANLKMGIKTYNTTKPGDRVEAVSDVKNFPESSAWLAMELAPGKSYAEFAKTSTVNASTALDNKIDYLIRGMAISELAKKWMLAAFFQPGPGFYHGDLHAGNIMIDVDKEAIKKYLAMIHAVTDAKQLTYKIISSLPKRFYKLTLIDFGNSGYLTLKEKLHVFNFFIAVGDLIHSPLGFLEAYKGLVGSLGFSQENKLSSEVRKIFAEHKTQDGLLGAITNLFLDGDYPKFPAVMANFGRSQAMLDNIFVGLQKDAARLGIVPEPSFTFMNAVEYTMTDLVLDGTLDIAHQVGMSSTGYKIYVNFGNAMAGILTVNQTLVPYFKKKLGISQKDVGDKCSSDLQCADWGLSKDSVACCQGKCVVKKKDWAGVYYCPHVCKGSIGGAAGTCK